MDSTTPSELVCEFVVLGVPISAQTHNNGAKVAWMTSVADAARDAWGPRGPLSDDLAAFVTYYGVGGWHLDLDNMAKPILDAVTGVVWSDDKQLVDIHPARRELDGLYYLRGISEALAKGFVSDGAFVHMKITTPPDRRRLS